MDQIHDYTQSHSVGGVDKALQLLRGAEARGRREEGGDVVAEGAVVWMLHDGHELHGVVAGLLDAREHVVAELGVGSDLLFL